VRYFFIGLCLVLASVGVWGFTVDGTLAIFAPPPVASASPRPPLVDVNQAVNQIVQNLFPDVNTQFDAEKYIKKVGLPCDGNSLHLCLSQPGWGETVDYNACTGQLGFPSSVCLAGPVAIKDWNSQLKGQMLAQSELEKEELRKQALPALAGKIESIQNGLQSLNVTQFEGQKQTDNTVSTIIWVCVFIVLGLWMFGFLKSRESWTHRVRIDNPVFPEVKTKKSLGDLEPAKDNLGDDDLQVIVGEIQDMHRRYKGLIRQSEKEGLKVEGDGR